MNNRLRLVTSVLELDILQIVQVLTSVLIFFNVALYTTQRSCFEGLRLLRLSVEENEL